MRGRMTSAESDASMVGHAIEAEKIADIIDIVKFKVNLSKFIFKRFIVGF